MNPGGLIPPAPLKLSGNVWENWKNFKERFSIYMTAGNLHKNPEKVKVAIFLNLIGDEAHQLFKILKYPEEDREEGVTLKLIMGGFANYFKTCNDSIEYNSAKFIQREQLEGETFENFVMAVSHIAVVCKFDNIDRMLRDKILASVRDSKLRSRLLMLEDKSLDNVMDFCLEYEENNEKEGVTVTNDESHENFLDKKIYSRFGKRVIDSSSIGDSTPCSSNQSDENIISRALNINSIGDKDAADASNKDRHIYDFFNEPSCSKYKDTKSLNKKKSQVKINKKGKKVRKFKCSVCSKSYFHYKHLIFHRKLHSGKGTYKCNICRKQYLVKFQFNRHVEGHTMEKLFNCSHCGKKFAYKNQLALHVRTHKSE